LPGIEKNEKPMKTGNQTGFTVIEIVVFILIVGIVGGIVGIQIGNYNANMALDRAARQVLSDVRYAQEMAMSTNRGVDFNVRTNGYTLTWDDGSALQSTFGKGSVEVNLSELNATISGTDVSFDREGLPGGSVTLTVSNSAGSRTITVNGNTGYSALN
jgi:type II secretory pathway pseudopilin PulG